MRGMQYNIIRNESKTFSIDHFNKVAIVDYKIEVILQVEFDNKHLEFEINEVWETRSALENGDVDLEAELQKIENSANKNIDKKVQSIISKFQALEKFRYHLQD